MRRSLLLALSIPLFATGAMAQSPASYEGKWTLSWKTPRGMPREARVEITPTGGTWTPVGHSGREEDPCLTRTAPIRVEASTEQELTLKIERRKILGGCTEPRLVLRKTADGTLETTYGGGSEKAVLKRN